MNEYLFAPRDQGATGHFRVCRLAQAGASRSGRVLAAAAREWPLAVSGGRTASPAFLAQQGPWALCSPPPCRALVYLLQPSKPISITADSAGLGLSPLQSC